MDEITKLKAENRRLTETLLVIEIQRNNANNQTLQESVALRLTQEAMSLRIQQANDRIHEMEQALVKQEKTIQELEQRLRSEGVPDFKLTSPEGEEANGSVAH